ncbi:MAG: VOC family protein [Armatimonadetes bacterium]|nr:VOC family protein [Armatimonadota bacterium]
MSTQTTPVTVTNWFEVYSPNVEAAKSFYGEVFGWTADSMPMGPDSTYWMLKKGDTTFAGIMDMNSPELAGVPPHWGLYLNTDDCAATIAKASELGAKVIYGPMDIPDIGTVAGFTDCCGAHFNVHQPAGERDGLPGSPVNWIEQMGPDRAKAVSFYTSLFGWGSMDMDMGPETGIYSMFMLGETPIAGCMNVPAEAGPACWMVYLHSDNLEATCEKVVAAGGKVMFPAKDIGQFGRIAIAADCCGAVFGLHQPPMA